jgi:hypothetical protein
MYMCSTHYSIQYIPQIGEDYQMLTGEVVTEEIRVAESEPQLVQSGSRHVCSGVVVQSRRQLYVSFTSPRYDGSTEILALWVSSVVVKCIVDEEEGRFGAIRGVSFHQGIMIEFGGIFAVVLIHNKISETQNLVSQLTQTLGAQHQGLYITSFLYWMVDIN